MEYVLITKALESLINLEINNTLGFLMIFIFIWLQVKGLKKQVKKLSDGLEAKRLVCEKRFTTIEDLVLNEKETWILKPNRGKT